MLDECWGGQTTSIKRFVSCAILSCSRIVACLSASKVISSRFLGRIALWDTPPLSGDYQSVRSSRVPGYTSSSNRLPAIFTERCRQLEYRSNARAVTIFSRVSTNFWRSIIDTVTTFGVVCLISKSMVILICSDTFKTVEYHSSYNLLQGKDMVFRRCLTSFQCSPMTIYEKIIVLSSNNLMVCSSCSSSMKGETQTELRKNMLIGDNTTLANILFLN
jgi:hypothetical protein